MHDTLAGPGSRRRERRAPADGSHGTIPATAGDEDPRFRDIFDQALQFMGLLTPDGTVLAANRTALEFAGLSREDVIGRPFWETAYSALDADTRNQIRDAVLRAAAGTCVRSHASVTAADGRRMRVEFSIRPIRDGAGNVVLLLPEGRDVTDRVRTEEALRKSETRLAGILEIAADAIVSIDGDHRIVQFNRAAERTFGYVADEVIGGRLEMLMPDRFAEAHRDHVNRFGTSGEPRRMVGRRVTGRRRSGDEFAAQAVVSMLEVGGERIYTAVIRDLTEEQRHEIEQEILAEAGRALTASLDYEETLRNVARLVVHDLADFCVIDIRGDDGKVRRFATAARDPAHQPLADRLGRFSVPADRRHIALLAWRTRRAELLHTTDDVVLRQLANDDEHYELLRSLQPGSVIAAPMIARDHALGVILLISRREHRPYDRRDCALAEELGRRAALAIDNARLYREAQESGRARQRILAIVAHDLRSPLNGITMAADMLRHYLKDDPNPAHRRPADAILQEADQMNRLIQDLLDVRAIEGGGIAVDPLPVPSEVLIIDATEQFRTSCKAAGIALLSEHTTPLPRVLADRARVARVFANLIANAIRFTPRGGRITLGALPDGDYVRFEVSDSGPGIPEADQERIFTPFWQGENADRQGAGLGLSIARGIVAAHGGHLAVSSAPPNGSTFTFTLPRAG